MSMVNVSIKFQMELIVNNVQLSYIKQYELDLLVNQENKHKFKRQLLNLTGLEEQILRIVSFVS